MNNAAIFFVHGGPGLSSSYFKGWFSRLEKDFDLLFYDQNYKIPRNVQAIDYLVDEFITRLNDTVTKYNKVVIFAHSWGVFLTLQAFSRQNESHLFNKIEKFIFSNPSDSNWINFCNAGNELFARMPQETINNISKCTDGIRLMNMALPYYLGNQTHIPKIIINRYDIEAYDRVSEEMEGYNVSSIISKLPKNKVYTIYCENDFEHVCGSPEFIKNSNVLNFPNAGHFPFAEYPNEYAEMLYKILL